MLALAIGLRVHAHLIFSSKVNLVNWFFSLAKECVFERAYLVMLVHCVAWNNALVQGGA